jgi:hypothetical protein
LSSNWSMNQLICDGFKSWWWQTNNCSNFQESMMDWYISYTWINITT